MRTADRARVARGVGGGQRAVGHVHGRLGDAVHVHERRAAVARSARTRASACARSQRLAAEDDEPQLEMRPRTPSSSLMPSGTGSASRSARSRPRSHEQLGEQLRRTRRPVRRDDEPAAVQQRTPELPHGEVEGVRMEEHPGVSGPKPNHSSVAVNRRATWRCSTMHALRPARRSRRVDHVREVLGLRPRSSGASGRALARRDVAIDAERPCARAAAAASSRRSCVSSTGRRVSSRTNASRSAGYSGSSGTYAPPALSTPRIATTSSSDRSRHSATSVSRSTPASRRRCASGLARSFELSVGHRLALERHRRSVRRLRRARARRARAGSRPRNSGVRCGCGEQRASRRLAARSGRPIDAPLRDRPEPRAAARDSAPRTASIVSSSKRSVAYSHDELELVVRPLPRRTA